MIATIVDMLRRERSAVALLAVAGRLLEQVIGRIHARLLGWGESYIGYGSRVIGSRAIRVQGRAYINRYCWMEAVHSFRGQRFDPQINIGRGFSVSDRLHLSCVRRVDIGDDCLLGSGVYISDHNHGSYSGSMPSAPSQAPVDRQLCFTGPVVIGSRVWIGDNVVIVGQLTIGDGAVIGANSVVKGDVPANTIAAGIPARVLKVFNTASCQWETTSARTPFKE